MLRLSRLLSGGYLLIALLVTALTLIGLPLGPAPFQLAPLGAAGEPIVVEIAYGTEKKAWLEDAAARFAASSPRVRGRPITIVLKGLGSREIVTDIVQNGYQPTVVSPASMVQVELLRSQWEQQAGGQAIFASGADAPQPLVITPLVLVSWADRAAAVEQGGAGEFWGALHDVIVAPGGWADLGHPEWGRVKFSHTSPETSNSGLQTLLLLAYSYTNKSSGLTVEDVSSPAFRDWLGGIENTISNQKDSTGELMTDMLRFGPGTYDAIAVYENLAIESIATAANRGQDLHISYPPANILSEHPYAVLSAPWVSNEQRQAAALFRDFLLSREMQELALKSYGFRPASPQVQIDPNDAASPFSRYTSAGVKLDIAEQVTVPSGDVLDALLATWRQVAAS
jgi:ABC-type Fe3+ transport system substrate-binding protein